jgi:hypothetical protein
MSISGVGPSFGSSGDKHAKFGNNRINSEMTAHIMGMRQAIDDKRAEAAKLKKDAEGHEGGDHLLQATLLGAGALSALTGFGATAAILWAYPFMKGLVKFRHSLNNDK